MELRVRVRVRVKARASAMARPRVRVRVRAGVDEHREELLRRVALLVTVAVALLDGAPGQRHHAQLRPQHLARVRG